MLAAIRPDSWNLPLFLHVLGAVCLFGAIASVLVLGLAAHRNTAGHAPLLARVSFWTLVLLALPAWILMRVGAQLIADKEFPGNTPNPDWLGVGYGVSEGGLVLLIVLGILAFFSMRRGGAGRTAAAVPALAGLYVVALAVAWFAMSGKPGG
jgi:hypothetical protein